MIEPDIEKSDPAEAGLATSSGKTVASRNPNITNIQPQNVKTIHINKPLGHATIAAIICGLVGGLLGVLLDLLNRFDGLRASLLSYYKSDPILMSDPAIWSPVWDWVGSTLFAIIVAYVVLDSVGKWRRIIFGMIVIILTLAFSPLLMLWDVFWVPCVAVSAIVWTWLCAYFYASQHVMPCELGIPIKVIRKKNVTGNYGQQSITLRPTTKDDRNAGFKKLKKMIKRKPKAKSKSKPKAESSSTVVPVELPKTVDSPVDENSKLNSPKNPDA